MFLVQYVTLSSFSLIPRHICFWWCRQAGHHMVSPDGRDPQVLVSWPPSLVGKTLIEKLCSLCFSLPFHPPIISRPPSPSSHLLPPSTVSLPPISLYPHTGTMTVCSALRSVLFQGSCSAALLVTLVRGHYPFVCQCGYRGLFHVSLNTLIFHNHSVYTHVHEHMLCKAMCATCTCM